MSGPNSLLLQSEGSVISQTPLYGLMHDLLSSGNTFESKGRDSNYAEALS